MSTVVDKLVCGNYPASCQRSLTSQSREAAIASGTPLAPVSTAAAMNDIPAGHKVALSAISEGAEVFRLGQPIGLAATNQWILLLGRPGSA